MRITERVWILVFGLTFSALAHADDLNLLDLLRSAGVSIFAVGALSVLAVAVTLERLRNFRAQRLVPDRLVDDVLALRRSGETEALHQRLWADSSLLGQILRFALEHQNLGAAVVSQKAGDMASRALRQQQHKAYPLAVVATVAPIIGLLGTVIGMIEAFHVIATAGGLGDPALLAGGISKALVNTAAGLTVALPALALHHYFKHRLLNIALILETEVNRVLDELFLAVPST